MVCFIIIGDGWRCQDNFFCNIISKTIIIISEGVWEMTNLELLKVVYEDLYFLRDEWNNKIDPKTIRITGSILRRLLVESELQKAWNGIKYPMLLNTLCLKTKNSGALPSLG